MRRSTLAVIFLLAWCLLWTAWATRLQEQVRRTEQELAEIRAAYREAQAWLVDVERRMARAGIEVEPLPEEVRDAEQETDR